MLCFHSFVMFAITLHEEIACSYGGGGGDGGVVVLVMAVMMIV
jgi:hypothetical protein